MVSKQVLYTGIQKRHMKKQVDSKGSGQDKFKGDRPDFVACLVGTQELVILFMSLACYSVPCLWLPACWEVSPELRFIMSG